MTFGAHQLVHSDCYWTTYRNFDTCCQRYLATCGRNWIFAISRNLCRHLATKMRIMYCLWMADPFWKIWKPHQNRPINCHAILVRTMSPSNEQRCGLGAWQTKTVTNTIFSHLQPVKRIKSNLKR